MRSHNLVRTLSSPLLKSYCSWASNSLQFTFCQPSLKLPNGEYEKKKSSSYYDGDKEIIPFDQIVILSVLKWIPSYISTP